MKKLLKSILCKAAYLLIGLAFLFGAKTLKAQQIGYFPDLSTPVMLQFYCAGMNSQCPFPISSDISYKIQGHNIDWIPLPNAQLAQAWTIPLDTVSICPCNSIRINFRLHSRGVTNPFIPYCDIYEYIDVDCAVPSYSPPAVSNVHASNRLFQHKVEVSWDINEIFSQYGYIVYRNGMGIATLPAGTTTFTDSGLGEGWVYDYQVQGVVNGNGQGAVPPNASPAKGYTFGPNFTASSNHPNRVHLSWNDYSGVKNPGGYKIQRSGDGITGAQDIHQENGLYYTFYDDTYPGTNGLIPGYTYQYTFTILPTIDNDIVATAYGKMMPNGTISGSVKTPEPGGVGIPGVQIVATLQGAPLPTDGTTTYSTTTDANGNYTIPNIYYYNTAQFNVVPASPGRNFDPAQTLVTLNLTSPNVANVNFTDTSSYILTGTVTQGGCPRAGVHMLLNNDSTHVITDSLGVYHLTVPTGGNYTIKPTLENHTFSPAERTVVVLSDANILPFTDTKQYTLTGRFKASCNTSIGAATLKFTATSTGQNACDNILVTTDTNGYYSVVLPARNYRIQLLHFATFDQQILDSIDVLGYFWNIPDVDLTYYNSLAFHNDSTTLDFTYIEEPQLSMLGLSSYHTCSSAIPLYDSIPLMEQGLEKVVKFLPQEKFNGVSCPADDGFIVIQENISSDSVNVKSDTLFYVQGDTVSFPLTPGNPNIVPPYKKFIQAILVSGNQRDTVYTDVIVIGFKPRHSTFTTVSPEIPMHILHNPPGDNSYSFLEANKSISTSFKASYLKEGTNNEENIHFWGLVVGVSHGFLSTEAAVIYNKSENWGSGTSETRESGLNITTTTSELFQTSGNADIMGQSGDLYVGGALNLIYAVSDGVMYDFDSCKIDLPKTLWMQPNGFATTYMYTESHIVDFVIPDLQTASNILLNLPNATLQDSIEANKLLNQMHVWQQVVDNNHANIDSAVFVENKSFSGGVLYQNSLQTSRTNSGSIDVNYTLDTTTIKEIGGTIAGIGHSQTMEAKGRITIDTINSSDTTNVNTIGYVLSDDDPGDQFTVDVLKEKVYGVPAFKLVTGNSSCPYEDGTLPREGVQLISNNPPPTPYSQSVEESQAAVFYFQLGNLSQSGETMTYDLMFDHTSNPYGAHLSIGGSPIIGNVPYPYTIPVGTPAIATIEVTKGPDSATYDNLKFTLKSECDPQIYDDIYLNVHFYKNYDLTVAVNGPGTTNVPAGVHAYQEHSQVILYASPTQGYVFQKWIVGTNIYDNQAIMVTMDSSMTATAYFVQTTLPQYSLQISAIGNGITIPPAGTHYVLNDSLANLSAIADMENAFVKWVINGTDVFTQDTTITITENTTVVAHFTETRRLTILTMQGEGQTTPSQGIYNYPVGTSLQLYASPSLGYVFEKWMLDSVEYNTQNVDIIMAENIVAHAYFAPTTNAQSTLTMIAGNGGTTTPPSGQHYFQDGSTISLTAHPANGKVFEKWEINSIPTTVNPVNVTITGDVTAMVFFADDESGIGETTEVRHYANFYPNPSSGTVNIQSSGIINRILIYDIVGKNVYEKNDVNSSEYALNLNYLNSGVYFVKLFIGNQSSVYKIQLFKN